MRLAPVVKLYRNPWSATLEDGVVLQILMTAALSADDQLRGMQQEGDVEPDKDSFGVVLLDPTRPRTATTFAERVLATIELGPHGAHFLPNAAAKADAHDRHGQSNDDLVYEAIHCLGNDDFAWGRSAEYALAIGGGSGLSEEQDHELTLQILEEVMDEVGSRRGAWLKQQRMDGGSQSWLNRDNLPGRQYQDILSMVQIAAPDLVDEDSLYRAST